MNTRTHSLPTNWHLFFVHSFFFNFNRIFSINKSINSWFCEIRCAHELTFRSTLWMCLWNDCWWGGNGEWVVLAYLFTCVIHKIKCVCWNVWVYAKIKAPLNHKNHSNRNELENKRRKKNSWYGKSIEMSADAGGGGASKCVLTHWFVKCLAKSNIWMGLNWRELCWHCYDGNFKLNLNLSPTPFSKQYRNVTYSACVVFFSTLSFVVCLWRISTNPTTIFRNPIV